MSLAYGTMKKCAVVECSDWGIGVNRHRTLKQENLSLNPSCAAVLNSAL